eukprot:Trichotokara_eunicae@DN4425_c0_g1_i1.p1
MFAEYSPSLLSCFSPERVETPAGDGDIRRVREKLLRVVRPGADYHVQEMGRGLSMLNAVAVQQQEQIKELQRMIMRQPPIIIQNNTCAEVKEDATPHVAPPSNPPRSFRIPPRVQTLILAGALVGAVVLRNQLRARWDSQILARKLNANLLLKIMTTIDEKLHP